MLFRISDAIAARTNPTRLTWLYHNAPAWFLRDLTLNRFQRTVRWAGEHSAFYRRAFKERGIDPNAVRKPSDLGDFYTVPDDLWKNPTDFLCKKPSIVFESSGTSGRNKQVYYSQEELKAMGAVMAAGMMQMGVTSEDRVANAFDFSIWIPGLLAHYGLMATGSFCLAFGKVDPIEVYRRLRDYRFNVVLGEPTWLIRLTELAEKDGSNYPLKVIIGGAEEMPVDAIPWMRKVWGGAQVKMCYGAVELGSSFGFQPCDNLDGYHIDDTDFTYEILDPDDNGYGELVLTTLRRDVMPLIRYRMRDVTRIEKGLCSCGIRAPRMAKLRGRRDELIVASGGNLYPLMFEKILGEVEGLTHDWQIVFKLEGIREVMEIHVESALTDEEALRDEIRRQMSEQYPDLMKNLALGIFDMRIIVRPPGGVRRGARKLKRMVDQRHFDGPSGPAYGSAASLNGDSHTNGHLEAQAVAPGVAGTDQP